LITSKIASFNITHQRYNISQIVQVGDYIHRSLKFITTQVLKVAEAVYTHA
jgi:hypothetical protein